MHECRRSKERDTDNYMKTLKAWEKQNKAKNISDELVISHTLPTSTDLPSCPQRFRTWYVWEASIQY